MMTKNYLITLVEDLIDDIGKAQEIFPLLDSNDADRAFVEIGDQAEYLDDILAKAMTKISVCAAHGNIEESFASAIYYKLFVFSGNCQAQMRERQRRIHDKQQ